MQARIIKSNLAICVWLFSTVMQMTLYECLGNHNKLTFNFNRRYMAGILQIGHKTQVNQWIKSFMFFFLHYHDNIWGVMLILHFDTANYFITLYRRWNFSIAMYFTAIKKDKLATCTLTFWSFSKNVITIWTRALLFYDFALFFCFFLDILFFFWYNRLKIVLYKLYEYYLCFIHILT